MRRFALLVLLLSCAACARKAQPVADGGAPELPDLVPVEVKPKKALDPNNFAGKSLAQWREDLRSKDRHKIITAMKACEALGPLAVDAIPDLLAADMSDEPAPDIGDQRLAFRALVKHARPAAIGAMGKVAVPRLVAVLDVADEPLGGKALLKVQTAYEALHCLSFLGPDAGQAIPQLNVLVTHTKSGLNMSASNTLGAVAGTDKRALPGLRYLLKSRRHCKQAIEALSLLDPDGTAEECVSAAVAFAGAPVLIDDLSNAALFRFGPKGVAAVVTRCKRADGSFERGLLGLLNSVPAESLAPHVPEFVKWLDVATDKDRESVCAVLRAAGSRARAAAPRLLELARAGDNSALVAAATVGAPWKDISEAARAHMVGLGWLAPALEYVPEMERARELEPFLKRMRGANGDAKRGLAKVLLECDPAQVEAAAVLLEATIASEVANRGPEGRAPDDYCQLWPKRAVLALRAHLQHKDLLVRARAAKLILNIEPTDAEAVATVAGHLKSEYDRLHPPGTRRGDRAELCRSLGRAGPNGVTRLGELLSSEHQPNRWEAASILADIGPNALSAADALVACVGRESEPGILGFALRALGHISSPEKPLAAGARKHFGSPSGWVRFAAAEAWLACNPTDERALDILVEFVKPGRAKGTDFRPEWYWLRDGIPGEAIPLLFRLDPERAIRAEAFREPWFRY